MSARNPYENEGKMASSQVTDEAFEATDLPQEKAGTAMDRRDMARMGKTQELKVRTGVKFRQRK